MKKIRAIAAAMMVALLTVCGPGLALAMVSRTIRSEVLLPAIDEHPDVYRDPVVDSLSEDTRKQVLCTALAVYFEARGEIHEGQLAVALVVRNRVNRSGNNYCAIVFAPAQFSWTYYNISRLFPTSRNAWEKSLRIGHAVVTDPKLIDITEGATHFYAPDLVSPIWAKFASSSRQIGGHMFIRIDSWRR